MNKNKIISNKVRCKECDDIIESIHRHDFKECKCGLIYIDGGRNYLRRGWTNVEKTPEECFEELSEYEDD
jgi:hypothetical protein